MLKNKLTEDIKNNSKICKSKYTDLEYNFNILENNQILLWKNEFNVIISKEMFNELYEEKICA